MVLRDERGIQRYYSRRPFREQEKQARRWRKLFFETPGCPHVSRFMGATKGKKLFVRVRLTVKYFFETFDAELWRNLLYRSLDFEGDVLKHPDYLDEAYTAGKELVEAIKHMK